ncbi:hypothetical protein [Microvirga sp. TS319]
MSTDTVTHRRSIARSKTTWAAYGLLTVCTRPPGARSGTQVILYTDLKST